MKKNKTCFDCLNCKVSAKSTEKCRMCFCAITKKEKDKEIRHKEAFWLKKKLCIKFVDMTA
jgi:hypothetical protein